MKASFLMDTEPAAEGLSPPAPACRVPLAAGAPEPGIAECPVGADALPPPCGEPHAASRASMAAVVAIACPRRPVRRARFGMRI
ncbi:hypothetical protein Sviol_54740 [Streptomyces violascens]|uniref:Uncharacterized protein n=1 Tax=Streptomyces violascens TaxID=67381 RepID=A0ABQ3QUV5_9ACTN|nr:hypothetical protein Sviol_54740 [Streptomyces violascens]